jgi:DNA-binding XRE family transcriptional regulator
MNELIKQQLDLIDSINPKFKKKVSLNQKELAEIIGVSPSTIETRRKEGVGIEYIQFGNRILYPKIKIAEFLAQTVKTA